MGGDGLGAGFSVTERPPAVQTSPVGGEGHILVGQNPGGDRVGAGEGPGPRELCLLPASVFRLLSASFRLGVRPSLSYECLCLMPLEPCLLTA